MLCLIVDDEEPARRHLRALLSTDPGWQVVAEADTGALALEAARLHKLDVAFLDIQIPPPGGIDVARELVELPDPPEIVFLTGHQEHAVEAFDIGVTDYLLKPVRRNRLRQTLQRVRERRLGRGEASEPPLGRVLLSHPVKQTQDLVDLAEVSWFTAEGDQVWAMAGGERYRVGQSLSKLEAALTGQQFVRTHKSYLVNLRRVRRLVRLSRHTHVLQTDCGREVPLSRHYLEAFLARVPGL